MNPEDTETDTPPSTRRSALSVLIVDDQGPLLELISRIFALDGHTTTTCQSGREALEWLERQSFDLVLSDIGMPGMSGLELCAEIRRRWPDQPVALLTGWGTELTLEAARARGAFAVLNKPFQAAQLRALLASLPPRSPASG
jgi:CheY-like chemotaxis protein